MPHLPRVPAFPIAGERSILTAAGAALKIPAKEKDSPLIGHYAPEIYAQDHLGRYVSLHATIELGRPIVLYFFPLAGSPHCTKESCSFRDAVGTSPIFNDLNAVVIGISQDPPARSRRFVDEHHLGFRILHDSNREIMDAWGVGRGLLGLIDGRCTFIIDHDGVVRAMLDGVWDYKGHRDFAEKWLCKIEHELSGRQRFYVEHEADDTVACDEMTRNVRVVYGDALPGRAIAVAPRHGAAPAAAKSKSSSSSLKPPPEPKTASLSLAAEANRSGSLGRAKSRRNLRKWLRPSDASNGTYDEPLHVDYKLVNRSLDDVNRERQARMVEAGLAVRSTDQAAVRVRDDPAAAVIVRDFAMMDLLPARQASGSGSGCATPSTISAGSVSTGETSHTSPGPESHATKLAAAIKNGIAGGNAVELERAGSARRRGNDSTAASQAGLTQARSSSLNMKKASSTDHATAGAGEASFDLQKAKSIDGHAGSPATVYANGNIARMPLLPAVNGEFSNDSINTVGHDRRSRNAPGSEVSADSNFSNASSLPVPPRPSTRTGTAGGVVAAAAAARLQSYASVGLRPSSAPVVREASSSSADTEDGYETDRAPPAKRVDAQGSPSGGASATASPARSRTQTPTSPRLLPPQRTAPAFAPPPVPSAASASPSPSTSFVRRDPSRATVTPSPSSSSSSIVNAAAPTGLGIAAIEAKMMERRLSSTPSLSGSMVSTSTNAEAFDGASVMGDGRDVAYSPSLAGSTHTFGGMDD